MTDSDLTEMIHSERERERARARARERERETLLGNHVHKGSPGSGPSWGRESLCENARLSATLTLFFPQIVGARGARGGGVPLPRSPEQRLPWGREFFAHARAREQLLGRRKLPTPRLVGGNTISLFGW